MSNNKKRITNEVDNKEFIDSLEGLAMYHRLSMVEVMDVLGASMQKAWSLHFGTGYDLGFEYDNKNWEFRLFRNMHVVAEVTNPQKEVLGEEVGEIQKIEIPMSVFHNEAVRSLLDIIHTELRALKKTQELEIYEHKIGEILKAKIKRVNGKELSLLIHGVNGGYNTEAMIPYNYSVNREQFRVGDVILARLYDVRSSVSGCQLYCERKSNDFVVGVLKLIVPEVQEGKIVVKNIVREPGVACKILVDGVGINPIGPCLGPSGQRRKQLMSELSEERVDFVQWKEDLLQRISICFKNIENIRIVQNENNKVTVIVSDTQVSEAIGKGGSNAKMIGQLLGIHLNIVSESTFVTESDNEYTKQIKDLVSYGIDEEAAVLITKNYLSLEHAMNDPNLPEHMIQILQTYIQDKYTHEYERLVNMGCTIINDNISLEVFTELAKHGILTTEHLQSFKNARELMEAVGLPLEIAVVLMNE